MRPQGKLGRLSLAFPSQRKTRQSEGYTKLRTVIIRETYPIGGKSRDRRYCGAKFWALCAQSLNTPQTLKYSLRCHPVGALSHGKKGRIELSHCRTKCIWRVIVARQTLNVSEPVAAAV